MEQDSLLEHTTSFHLEGIMQTMNQGCIIVLGDSLSFLKIIIEQHTLGI